MGQARIETNLFISTYVVKGILYNGWRWLDLSAACSSIAPFLRAEIPIHDGKSPSRPLVVLSKGRAHLSTTVKRRGGGGIKLCSLDRIQFVLLHNLYETIKPTSFEPVKPSCCDTRASKAFLLLCATFRFHVIDVSRSTVNH